MKPDDWPDIKQIYQANKDPNYKNAIIWLLDADEIGRNNPDAGVKPFDIAPRTIKLPIYQITPKQAGNNIEKVVFSDGYSKVLTKNDNKLWYHTFTGTDKYVWVMFMNNLSIEDGEYYGMQYTYEGGYDANNTSILWVYGDKDSGMLCGYNGPFRGTVKLRNFEVGNVISTNSITFNTVPSLERLKIGNLYSNSSGASGFLTTALNIKEFKIGKIIPMSGTTSFSATAFSGCNTLKKIEINDIQISFQSTASLFSGNYLMESYPIIDTSESTSFSSMFYSCSNLVSLHEMDASQVTNFGNMCFQCYKLEEIPSTFNFSNATTHNRMFYQCFSLRYIPDIVDCSKSTNVSEMFSGCQ